MIINPTRTDFDEIVTTQTNLGIEVEKMRVDPAGHLSQAPFPAHFSAVIRPFVEREYFQAQIEFALPVSRDVACNIARSTAIINEAASQLRPQEHFWPYSCPPALTAPLTASAIADEPATSMPYRQRLGQRYDLRRLMNTGVHLNISFAPAAATVLCSQGDFASVDYLYVHLAQWFMLHRWVFTYLFGATPRAFAGYFSDLGPAQPVRSLRNSRFGFPSNIHGDYSSVTGYVTRIERAIAAGELLQVGQYYEPVRLKNSAGKDLAYLRSAGVTHLELRGFDLNPNRTLGVTAGQLRLVKSLALYFAVQPRLDPMTLPRLLAHARAFNDQVALEDPRVNSVSADRGVALFTKLLAFARENQFPPAYQLSIQEALTAFLDTKQTLAYQVWQRLRTPHPASADPCAPFQPV